MNRVTSKVIEALSNYEGGTALSIYMPTVANASPPALKENRTRFKNLARQAIEELRSNGSDDMATRLDELMNSKVNDAEFWYPISHGMALFMNQDEVGIYHLPVEVAEQVYVSSTFDTLPLYHLQTMNQNFYLFALALREPVIYRASVYELEPVVVDFPKSIEDALNIDEMFANSNTIRQGSGSMKTNPHGQGDSQEAGQEERLMYLRKLSDILNSSDQVDTSLPILIAATDNEAADFRAHSKNLVFFDTYLPGNRTKDDLAELHRLAMDAVRREVTEKKAHETKELIEQKMGAEKITSDMHEMRAAAEEGRVETLLLSLFDESSDTVSDSSNEIKIPHHESLAEKNKILELVKLVVKYGGKVMTSRQNLMPNNARLATVLRY